MALAETIPQSGLLARPREAHPLSNSYESAYQPLETHLSSFFAQTVESVFDPAATSAEIIELRNTVLENTVLSAFSNYAAVRYFKRFTQIQRTPNVYVRCIEAARGNIHKLAGKRVEESGLHILQALNDTSASGSDISAISLNHGLQALTDIATARIHQAVAQNPQLADVFEVAFAKLFGYIKIDRPSRQTSRHFQSMFEAVLPQVQEALFVAKDAETIAFPFTLMTKDTALSIISKTFIATDRQEIWDKLPQQTQHNLATLKLESNWTVEQKVETLRNYPLLYSLLQSLPTEIRSGHFQSWAEAARVVSAAAEGAHIQAVTGGTLVTKAREYLMHLRNKNPFLHTNETAHMDYIPPDRKSSIEKWIRGGLAGSVFAMPLSPVLEHLFQTDDTILNVCQTCDYIHPDDAVNAAENGATVKIAEGTYAPQAGDNHVIEAVDKTITIEGGYDPQDMNAPPDPDAHPTVLDAQFQPETHGVEISGGNVTLSGLTIIQGNAAQGGGVFIGSSETSYPVVAITNSIIEANAADYGGGIYASDGTNLTVSDSQILSNNAEVDGGGIMIAGDQLTTERTIFQGNVSTDTSALDIQGTQSTNTNDVFTQNIGAEVFDHEGTAMISWLRFPTFSENTGAVIESGRGYTYVDSGIIAGNDIVFRADWYGARIEFKSGGALTPERNVLWNNTIDVEGPFTNTVYPADWSTRVVRADPQLKPDGYHIQEGSAAINIAGTSTTGSTDFDGNPKPDQVSYFNDAGAIEFQPVVPPTDTPTMTPSPTFTETFTATPSPSDTPTDTPEPPPTDTNTPSPSDTPTNTLEPTTDTPTPPPSPDTPTPTNITPPPVDTPTPTPQFYKIYLPLVSQSTTWQTLQQSLDEIILKFQSLFR
jgi:hypothetical protein